MNGEIEQEAWSQALASRIKALGLSSAALALIEIARPLRFLGSQILLLAHPLLAGLISNATVEHTLTLLDDPDALERLISRLEGETP